MFVKFKRNLWVHFRDFGIKFLWLEIHKNSGNLDVRPLSAVDMQFYLMVVSLFLEFVWKIMEMAPADCYKEGFD